MTSLRVPICAASTGGPGFPGSGTRLWLHLLKSQEKMLAEPHLPLAQSSIPKALKMPLSAMNPAWTEGKKIKGRKRRIAVDSMGNLLWAVAHAANIHDIKSGFFPALGAYTLFTSIQKVCADAGCRGAFIAEAAGNPGIEADIVARNRSKLWEILPKRWIVERAFAWLNNFRRLSKDYGKTADSAEAMTRISHIHTLIKRL